MRCQSVALFAALALASATVAQDAQEPLRYEAHFTVKAGQEKAFVDLVNKYNKPLLDKLVADGTLLSWGIATPVLHGGADQVVWWYTPNYGGLDKVFAGLEEVDKQIAADGALQAFLDTVVIGKHYDVLLRTIVFKQGSFPEGTLPYISLSSRKVEPGEGRAWRGLWQKYIQPVYDKLLEDGVILAYGLDVEAEHSTDATWRWTWYLTPDLAAIDGVEAAFDDAYSSEAWRGIVSQFRAISVPNVHRDRLLSSLVFNTGE